MKVAIMGAGLSGLSCAFMLEKQGIIPDIFEKRGEVGDRFINGEAFLSILNRPHYDAFRYFAEEFNLFLKPTSHINRLTIKSPNEMADIDEHLGFVNIRGRHPSSLEKQLAEQVQSDITFHCDASYEDLLQEYSHVILATGDADYAIKLHNFREDLSVSIKGATVEGNFDRFSVFVWLDNQFAPKGGYGYLLPYSDNEANIALAHPDLPGQSPESQQDLWNGFLEEARNVLKQSLKVTDEFQISNYIIGTCQHPRIGNTFFTGNNFGAIMPFIGFGQFTSILTGIYAAYDICGLGSYEQLTKPLKKSYENSLILRQAMEGMSNSTYDFIVKNVNSHLGKKFFTQRKFDLLKVISYLYRPFAGTFFNKK